MRLIVRTEWVWATCGEKLRDLRAGGRDLGRQLDGTLLHHVGDALRGAAEQQVGAEIGFDLRCRAGHVQAAGLRRDGEAAGAQRGGNGGDLGCLGAETQAELRPG